MKIISRFLLPTFLTLSILCLASTTFSAEALKIGAAEIDITPPVGHRMAGYFDERLSTGVHDPLKAKAIILQQDKEKIAMVFCDLVGVSLTITTNARAQASANTGIPVSNIVICATHSHTGPLFDDVRRHYFHEAAVEKYGKDPQEKIYYPDFLIERLVKVIGEANKKLHPAELEVTIAKQEDPQLNFNRRYWMKNGKVAFNPGQLNPNIVKPAGPIDDDLPILLAHDPGKQKPFAGITVFAMHSDTVGGTKYSADYAYYIQETLRQEFGKNFISAFGAGTCGDINHINVNKKEPFKGFEMAEYLGTNLGKTILASRSQLQPLSKPSLAVRSTILSIPLQEPTPEQLADAHAKISKLGDTNTDFFTKVVAVKMLDLERRGPVLPMEVQVFRLDSDTAIVCLPAEIFVDLGLAIKHASPFKKTIVISICNDRPSYVPTKKAFIEGSYEVTNSRVKSGAGEMFVDAAVKLLNEVKQN
jgi:neutral ceramidase